MNEDPYILQKMFGIIGIFLIVVFAITKDPRPKLQNCPCQTNAPAITNAPSPAGQL